MSNNDDQEAPVKTNIGEMGAGDEMNALIAEILGAKWLRFYDADCPDPDSSDGKIRALIVLPKDFGFLCPPDYVEDTGECLRDRYGWIPMYSSDFAAAWAAAEEVSDRYGCNIAVEKIGKIYRFGEGTYAATISYGSLSYERPSCVLDMRAHSAALATCRVIIKAVNTDPTKETKLEEKTND